MGANFKGLKLQNMKTSKLRTIDERGILVYMIILYNYVSGTVKLDKNDFVIVNKRGTKGHSTKIRIKLGDKDVNINIVFQI